MTKYFVELTIFFYSVFFTFYSAALDIFFNFILYTKPLKNTRSHEYTHKNIKIL